jgi:hypothetical protein
VADGDATGGEVGRELRVPDGHGELGCGQATGEQLVDDKASVAAGGGGGGPGDGDRGVAPERGGDERWYVPGRHPHPRDPVAEPDVAGGGQHPVDDHAQDGVGGRIVDVPGVPTVGVCLHRRPVHRQGHGRVQCHHLGHVDGGVLGPGGDQFAGLPGCLEVSGDGLQVGVQRLFGVAEVDEEDRATGGDRDVEATDRGTLAMLGDLLEVGGDHRRENRVGQLAGITLGAEPDHERVRPGGPPGAGQGVQGHRDSRVRHVHTPTTDACPCLALGRRENPIQGQARSSADPDVCQSVGFDLRQGPHG